MNNNHYQLGDTSFFITPVRNGYEVNRRLVTVDKTTNKPREYYKFQWHLTHLSQITDQLPQLMLEAAEGIKNTVRIKKLADLYDDYMMARETCLKMRDTLAAAGTQ